VRISPAARAATRSGRAKALALQFVQELPAVYRLAPLRLRNRLSEIHLLIVGEMKSFLFSVWYEQSHRVTVVKRAFGEFQSAIDDLRCQHLHAIILLGQI
jgi:hypothetical protein